MDRRLEKRLVTSHHVSGDIIPRLVCLRRVPTRYQHVLPLSIMKTYQCIVVGGESGSLTVAITNRKNVALLNALGALVGRPIFPVLIDPDHLHLLIRRIERAEHEKRKALKVMVAGYPLHVHSMLMFLTTPKQHR
jgi:hypothetical protein